MTGLLLLAVVAAGAVMAQDAEDDPVVLRHGEYEERLSDLDARFEIALRGVAASEGVALTDELRAQLTQFKPSFLEQRATEVALIQEAEQRGIQVAEDLIDAQVESVRTAIPEGDTLEALLERAGFTGEEQLRTLIRETEQIQGAIDAVQSEIEITESEIEEHYQDNLALFNQAEEVCASHILVESVDEAEALRTELEGGADFAQLAEEHSLDTATDAGDLGCFPRGVMVESFETAAFEAEVGSVVGPVESQFGQHLILVREHTPAGTAPLSQVRDQIEAQLRQERLPEVISALVEESGVETFPERLSMAGDPESSGSQAD